MKMLNKLMIVMTISLFVVSNIHASDVNWQAWSKNEILAKAEQENKLVFISLTAQWCMFCKKMDQTTYKDKLVIDQIDQHFIAVKADEADYPELVKQFANVGRPGTIILDSKGHTLVAKTGYLKPQWMLWMLQGTFADATTNMAARK